MTKLTPASLGTLGTTFVAMGLSVLAQTKPALARQSAPAPRPAMAVAHKASTPHAEPQPDGLKADLVRAGLIQADHVQADLVQADVVKQYCVGCHNDKGKAGGLSLASELPPGRARGRWTLWLAADCAGALAVW